MHEGFVLDLCILHLDGCGPLTIHANDESFWAHRDRDELQRGQILGIWSYAQTWDYQERHPQGDEVAIVLAGTVDFLVDSGGGEVPVRLTEGMAYVVPAGAWHRVAVHEPCRLMFVTPVPARTEHRPIVT